MPKYLVEYGIDVPAYGTVQIEADDLTELKAKIKQLHDDDKLIEGWTTHAEVGCSNERIVNASVVPDTNAELELIDNFQFDLDEGVDYCEQDKYLHIAYNKVTQKIDATATNRADLGMFDTDEYTITKVKL